MQIQHEHRRMMRREIVSLLQLPDEKVQQVVDIRQILPIRIAGEERFDSKDLYRLIDSQGKRTAAFTGKLSNLTMSLVPATRRRNVWTGSRKFHHRRLVPIGDASWNGLGPSTRLKDVKRRQHDQS